MRPVTWALTVGAFALCVATGVLSQVDPSYPGVGNPRGGSASWYVDAAGIALGAILAQRFAMTLGRFILAYSAGMAGGAALGTLPDAIPSGPTTVLWPWLLLAVVAIACAVCTYLELRDGIAGTPPRPER